MQLQRRHSVPADVVQVDFGMVPEPALVGSPAACRGTGQLRSGVRPVNPLQALCAWQPASGDGRAGGKMCSALWSQPVVVLHAVRIERFNLAVVPRDD